MFINEWASLAFICILGAFSPGPSLMVILSLTASNGRRAGYVASIGHGTGIFIYALLSATGLAIILISQNTLFLSIQILGAIFLFYIGCRIILSAFSMEIQNNSHGFMNKNLSNSFLDGFLIAILNPKILAFFLSLFSQFLVVGQALTTHLGMASLAGAIDISAYIIMVSLASTSIMQKFLSTYKKAVEFLFGFLLLILSVSLCFKITLDHI